MKKVILVDGNNLLFRSYYATAYTGNVMKNSKGFPTNALYGFILMMNKIIEEEKPEYIAVAFDIGKNFRKQKYETYKAGRAQTPDELKLQMPIARTILDAMGIKYFEIEPYEADDIIGTLAKEAECDKDFDATIISSDKDLLQLISNQVDVKLLKQKDYIRYDHDKFVEDWGFEPIRMIDFKALAGDPSDNILGVKGIGEKTAISLLTKYDTIEDIYEHIDEINGKLKDKLQEDKENAFISKEIATIYKEVPIDKDFNKMKYLGANEEELIRLYEDLEFKSLIKKHELKETKKEVKNIDIIYVNNIDEIEESSTYAYYIETDNLNYHVANILGMAVATKDKSYYIDNSLITDVINKIKDKVLYTFDLKKNIVLLNKNNIKCPNTIYDLMISSYLVELSDSDDMYYLLNQEGIDCLKHNELVKSDKIKEYIVNKVRYIYDSRDDLINKLKIEQMYDLFLNIEMPLINVLASMEIEGIKCDKNVLEEQANDAKIKIDELTKKIWESTGVEFNISSPKQLGDILFEKLNLPYGKKNKNGYSTDAKILQKLIDIHPIIKDILEYRNITKLYSTYLIGLQEYILDDNKIHTIYKQNLTRTGRLSSVDPNLQNIPARDEDGRKVRLAFLPSNDLLMSSDYSQIELRILAHVSKSKELQQAFIKGEDIHSRVAADIYGKNIEDVTKLERKAAKAVIFGIVYGITGFGLGEDLGISSKQAKEFIEKYYEIYPGVKTYMDNIVKEAYSTGVVRTLLNRKRTISELQSKNFMIRQSGERIALNTPIQGTEADIMKMAMIKVYNEFKKNNIKSKMILQVHDELIFDIVNEEKDIVQKIVKESMENIIKLDVPIIVSSDFGDNWYTTK
ncbi:MAG: DNA polymerase I [Bacilli bacterium]|nr:DNA polymerase I [Bacilli bacterium]